MAEAAAHYVPGELAEEILSRLPVKSLLRFKTACKNWYSLFSQDDKFSKLYMKQSKNKNHHHNEHIVFFQSKPGGRLFQSVDINDTSASRKFNSPAGEEIKQTVLIGSANGLMCLAVSRQGSCLLWNPLTRECKKIYLPVPSAYHTVFGFGYDSCSNDHKIVANWYSRFRVFSLKSNSWKILPYSYAMHANGFHLNGALHWQLRNGIAAFDLAKELFFSIQLPHEINMTHTLCRLWEYQGLLCLSACKSIWVMKKYRDSNSWVKLSTFLEHSRVIPLGISTLGQVVYQGEALKEDSGSRFLKSDIQGTMSDDDKSQIYSLSQPSYVYTEYLLSPRRFDGLHPPQSENMMIERFIDVLPFLPPAAAAATCAFLLFSEFRKLVS